MQNAPIRHRLEHAAYLLAKGMICLMSVPLARTLGGQFGNLAYALAGPQRRQANDNLALAMPELSAPERRRIARACFQHLGSNFFETLRIFRHEREDIERLIEVEGLENLQAAQALDKGLLLLTAHFGYWEHGGQWLGYNVKDFNVIYRQSDNPFFDAEISRLRGKAGVGLISKTNAGVKLLRTLKRGGAVAVLLDQRVPLTGIELSFFGQPVLTSPMMGALSLRTGAPVVPVFSYPLPGGRYHMRFDPMITADHEGRAGLEGDEAAAALTQLYNDAIEAEVRARPELWLWMHRRWRIYP